MGLFGKGPDTAARAAELCRARADDVQFVLRKLKSRQSRDAYRDMLAFHGTGGFKYLLRHVPDPDGYFRDAGRFMAGEVRAVDCGAYTGDTVCDLIRRYARRADRIEIDAFEPDGKNFAKLERTAARLADDKIIIRLSQACAYDQTVPVRFRSGLGAGSRIDPEGPDLIDSVRLEDEIRTGLPVSFLKICTSGSELGVLSGARGMIMSDRPYIAVRIGPGIESLLDVPVYLISAQPGYSWSFRTCSRIRPEGILYGVPESW